MAIEKSVFIEMLKTMLRIRLFEESATRKALNGELPATIHSYAGEEAIAVGVCTNLKPDDYIFSTHRAHGHSIAKGIGMKEIYAEVMGKVTGCCKGKAGHMHLADYSKGMMGGNGLVGASIPLAAGAALTSKVKGLGRVSISFFGDGASNTATFHEGINFAAVYDLPVVFVCENNHWGATMPQSCESIQWGKDLPLRITHQKISDISERAKAYGIPGVTVDGNDLLAVYEVAREAIERARSGQGPTLMECKTYNLHGYFAGDPMTYRPKEQAEYWKERDPIPRYRKVLAEMGVLTEDQMEEIYGEIERELKEAEDFGEDSPFPDASTAFEGVFSGEGVEK